jgi:hypothetical protein
VCETLHLYCIVSCVTRCSHHTLNAWRHNLSWKLKPVFSTITTSADDEKLAHISHRDSITQSQTNRTVRVFIVVRYSNREELWIPNSKHIHCYRWSFERRWSLHASSLICAPRKIFLQHSVSTFSRYHSTEDPLSVWCLVYLDTPTGNRYVRRLCSSAFLVSVRLS